MSTKRKEEVDGIPRDEWFATFGETGCIYFYESRDPNQEIMIEVNFGIRVPRARLAEVRNMPEYRGKYITHPVVARVWQKQLCYVMDDRAVPKSMLDHPEKQRMDGLFQDGVVKVMSKWVLLEEYVSYETLDKASGHIIDVLLPRYDCSIGELA